MFSIKVVEYCNRLKNQVVSDDEPRNLKRLLSEYAYRNYSVYVMMHGLQQTR